MKRKTVLFVSLALIFILLFSTSVLAQNVFEEIFEPLFGGLNLVTFYEDYDTIIDFLIAFVVFLSIGQLTITKQFKGRPGTAIAVALGFALSIGFSYVLHSQLGMNLAAFGPISILVFLLVVGIALYRYFTHWGEGVPGVGALIFVVGYSMTRAIVPGYHDWIRMNAPVVNAIIQLVFAGSLIYTFIVLFRVASKSFRGEITEAAKVAPIVGAPDKEERKREKEAKTKLKSDVDRLKARIEFMKTPLAELRKAEAASANPYRFVEEVMTKDDPYAFQEYGAFVNAVDSMLRDRGERNALKNLNKNAFEELQDSMGKINSVISAKPVLDMGYWSKLKLAINQEIGRWLRDETASPRGYSRINTWKNLSKELTKADEEEVRKIKAGEVEGQRRMEFKKTFMYKIKNIKVDNKKVWPDTCMSLRVLFPQMIVAIKAYEDLMDTKV